MTIPKLPYVSAEVNLGIHTTVPLVEATMGVFTQMPVVKATPEKVVVIRVDYHLPPSAEYCVLHRVFASEVEKVFSQVGTEGHWIRFSDSDGYPVMLMKAGLSRLFVQSVVS